MRTVTIVSGSAEFAEWFLNNHCNEEQSRQWEPFDARYLRLVKGTKVGNRQDCHTPNTVRVVFMQHGFVELICQIVDVVAKDGADKVIVNCEKGIHRASVIGETSCSALNHIVDSHGNRLFNCAAFHTWDTREWEQNLNNIWDWIQEPHELVGSGNHGDPSSFFGFNECSEDQRSQAAFDELIAYLHEKYFIIDHHVIAATDKSSHAPWTNCDNEYCLL